MADRSRPQSLAWCPLMSVETEILPFRIAIRQRDVNELERRLETSRWPDELPEVQRGSVIATY